MIKASSKEGNFFEIKHQGFFEPLNEEIQNFHKTHDEGAQLTSSPLFDTVYNIFKLRLLNDSNLSIDGSQIAKEAKSIKVIVVVYRQWKETTNKCGHERYLICF